MTPDYALLMARYNRWQNASLLDAASRLTPDDRTMDRGAFFGAIDRTFHHLYWADRIWMSRFSDVEPPAQGLDRSTEFDGDWQLFQNHRTTLDDRILAWAKVVDADWFRGETSWFSQVLGHQISKPRPLLVAQLFNHQTHHRGQIHAMLTAAGAHLQPTDIPFMPEAFETA